MSRLLMMQWTGDSFVPRSAYWQTEADKQYVVGQVYKIEAVEERSIRSHNRYFACIAEAWKNMPDDLLPLFPTAEHLRKHALIKAGYCDKRSIVCGSTSEARKVMAFIQPIDSYAIVTVAGTVVSIYTAQSQAMRAMGKKTFNESAERVLDEAAKLIGVSVEDLRHTAGKAA